MTTLLQEAFSAVSALDASKQDVFAKWILEELEDEQLWDDQFASSIDVLESLADEARAEHQAGKTKVLDPDKL